LKCVTPAGISGWTLTQPNYLIQAILLPASTRRWYSSKLPG
jgi:hypothetical protein